MSMAERIYQKRIENNMTMEELANRLNVGKSAVNKWEKGHVTNIKRETIQKMASIFNCNPAWLMGLDVPMDASAKTIEGIVDMAIPNKDKETREDMINLLTQYLLAPDNVKQTVEMILKSVPPKS